MLCACSAVSGTVLRTQADVLEPRHDSLAMVTDINGIMPKRKVKNAN
jgi:hypothetical protein